MDEKEDKQCPHCMKIFPFDFSFCPKCGKRSWLCHHCGHTYIYDFRICPNCGKKNLDYGKKN